jgi:quercetin dioxygenase-like cupin family protein
MSENLKKLRELTANLVPIPDIVTNHESGFVDMRITKGTCLGWKILIDRNTGVHKWFLSKGAEFPNHTHNCKEIMIVYEGEVCVIQNDQESSHKRGDLLVSMPGDEHALIAIEDTWFLTITIPLAEGYPTT